MGDTGFTSGASRPSVSLRSWPQSAMFSEDNWQIAEGQLAPAAIPFYDQEFNPKNGYAMDYDYTFGLTEDTGRQFYWYRYRIRLAVPLPFDLDETYLQVEKHYTQVSKNGNSYNAPTTVIVPVTLHIAAGQTTGDWAFSTPEADEMEKVTYSLVPIELRQHPISASSGVGDPPATGLPVRFCRWIDAYPNGIRDNQFADNDRDRFQIGIPAVIPNLTKISIRTTGLHGAVIDGDFQDGKTTDGGYEVDMHEVDGEMVSESILLVSDGDDDVTFNGKGTDDGANDQTLLANFGSQIIISFPQLGSVETTFQAQQPIGTVTLDMTYCAPKADGDPPVTIPGDLISFIEVQAQKMQEIYRQIGIKVTGLSIRPISFPATWVQDNGTNDPADNLDVSETSALMALVESSTPPSKRVRIGFVDASLTVLHNGIPGNVGGQAKMLGSDPCLISLDGIGRAQYNVLAHEVGHTLGLRHNFLYTPNIDHWLMREGAGDKWLNNSEAAKRLGKFDADYIQNNSSYYVPPQ